MKKCKQGYYYCYTDKKCKRIPLGYRVASSGYLRKENGEESGEDGDNNGNGNGNGNGNAVGNGNGNGGGNGGGVSESKSGDSSLRDWFGKSRSSDGKPGWVQLGGKYAGKPCAKQPGQTTKPKCGSSKMAANLDDKEEKKAFNRKQRQDPNPDRKGKAINVKTEETVVEKAGEKDACYKKVKSRYSVWPSAYASGALVKCRKKGAANWGNKSESVEYSDWRDDFQAMEYEFVDIIKPEPIKGGQEQIDEAIKGQDSEMRKAASIERKSGEKRLFPSTGKQYADQQKQSINYMDRRSKNNKIVLGMSSEEIEIEEKVKDCWDTHKKVGMKMKGGKLVNNCVRKEEKEESKVGGGNLKKLTAKAVKRIDADTDGDVDTDDMKSSETGVFVPSPDGKKKLKPKVRFEQSDWKSELEEGAAWTKKSGKSKSGGLNEKGRKSYEAENPGSDLKAPSKKVGNPRRKSFCARMKGMRKRQKPSNNTGDDRLSKSLRAWNC